MTYAMTEVSLAPRMYAHKAGRARRASEAVAGCDYLESGRDVLAGIVAESAERPSIPRMAVP
jgi:hypothetical protein